MTEQTGENVECEWCRQDGCRPGNEADCPCPHHAPRLAADLTVWAKCESCGGNIFRHYAWSHEGGTPPQDHDAEPAQTGRTEES